MSADPYQTRVPDGQYRVAFEKCEKGIAYGAPRWFVWFRITEPGPHIGLSILRFYNVPKRPWLPRTHNLWLDYEALIGPRPPSGLRPVDFLKGCEVLAEVVVVKHQRRGKKRVELHSDAWYSKIDRLIRITAGSPPVGTRIAGGSRG